MGLRYVLILFVALYSNVLFAQKAGNKWGKIDQAKKEFIAQKLSLTEEQKIKFWPLYSEFSKKRKIINKTKRQLNRQVQADSSLSNDVAVLQLNEILRLKQDELNLEKEYLNKFLKILSAKQVANLMQAEREFIKLLYKKIYKNQNNDSFK